MSTALPNDLISNSITATASRNKIQSGKTEVHNEAKTKTCMSNSPNSAVEFPEVKGLPDLKRAKIFINPYRRKNTAHSKNTAQKKKTSQSRPELLASGSSAGQIESAEDSNAIGSGWSKYSNFTRRTVFVPRARVGRQQLFPADSAKSPTDPTL